MHGFYTFLMFLSKRCRYAMINLSYYSTILTYKLYFCHFHFQVRRTHAYPHKKALASVFETGSSGRPRHNFTQLSMCRPSFIQNYWVLPFAMMGDKNL